MRRSRWKPSRRRTQPSSRRDPRSVCPQALADLRPLLQRFAEHSLRYHAYWPPGEHRRAAFPEPPAATLTNCLERIAAWEAEALPTIERLQGGATERAGLVVWQRALAAMENLTIDLAQALACGPVSTCGFSCSRRKASRRFHPDCSCAASRSKAWSTRSPSVPRATCSRSRNSSQRSRGGRIRCPPGCAPTLERALRTSRRASMRWSARPRSSRRSFRPSAPGTISAPRSGMPSACSG